MICATTTSPETKSGSLGWTEIHAVTFFSVSVEITPEEQAEGYRRRVFAAVSESIFQEYV